MKDGADTLKSILVRIKTAVSQDKYVAASRASTDLITLSYNLESKIGVFTGEVLETICMQIDHTLKTHLIPDEDRKKLNEKMTKYLDDLVNNSAQNIPCDLLASMRYETTVFQFEADFKYESPNQIRQRSL